MKQLLKVFSALALVGASAVGMSSCSGGKKSFVIGCSGPLTGGAAIYGTAVKNSAQMAIKEINENGGVLGAEFKLKMYDDQATDTQAANNYASLVDDGMQVSLACVTSGACLEFAKSAVQDNVFCLTPSATADKVYQSGSNVYQMCFNDASQGSLASEFILSNYADADIGIFYDSSDAYSNGIYENFKKTFTGKIKAEASFTGDTKTDFASQVTSLKDCNFIFMPIYYTEASLFIKQAKSQVADDAVYFGCDGLDGIDAVEGFDPNSYSQEISYLSHFNPNAEDTTVSNYVKNYTAAYGRDSLNQFGASAYDCIYAIKGAMEKAVADGKKIDTSITASDLCNILKDVFNGGYTYTGVTGKNVKWNQDGTVSKAPTKYVVNPDRTK